MTLANKITIARLVLIPVFIGFASYYSRSIIGGEAESWLRVAALVTFALASLGDALDGFVARRFNQISTLGKVLDPVADKLLLLSGIIVLSVSQWETHLPIWFAILVISRDILIVIGVIFLHQKKGKVTMHPIISSKICTFLQLSCVCWVLLDFWSTSGRPIYLDILVCLAGIFTVISAGGYLRMGIAQYREPDTPTP